MARFINQIIVHCSASPNGKSLFSGVPGEADFITPAKRIDGWHKTRGFKRDATFRKRLNPNLESIGYHFLIYTNGTTVTARHIEEVGAHVYGNNKNSLGICMVGTDQFTRGQFAALAQLIKYLTTLYPSAKVLGHRDCSPDKNNDGLVQPWEWLKICPGFDVASLIKTGVIKCDNIFEGKLDD